MPHQLDKRRSRTSRLGLLVVLCLGLALSAAGQSSSPGSVHFFNERHFEIPFNLGNTAGLRKVLLHVSADGRQFSQVATALPTEKSFVYNARADGWYSFVVQLQDQEGRLSPANVAQVPADLCVCVDTQKPQISLKPILPQGGTAGVEWRVSDKNLDLRTLRLAYRRVGSVNWTALNIRHLERAQFSWTPPEAGNYEVLLSVADRAGNRASAATQVKAAPSDPSMPGVSSAGRPRIKHVPSKTFRLDYTVENVGPSKVKRVEVWMTRDTRLWTLYKEDAPAKGPYSLTVERTGRYGFTLRPCSGVGRAPKPPDIGEQPQLWVQVDEAKPVVKIQSVTVGEGKENGSFTVHYSANDPHPKARPITISYSIAKEGPWKELLTNQENTGACRCPTEGLPFEFFVRVEAVDEAGNKGHDHTHDTVKIDLSTPVIKNLSAESVEGGARPAP